MAPERTPAPQREDAALYIRYAETHLRAGNLEQAGDSYQVALQFEARSVAAMTGLGQVHLKSGRLEDARKVLMRALAVAPGDHRARQLLGEVHAKCGRFDLMINEFKRAAECAGDERPRAVRRPDSGS